MLSTLSLADTIVVIGLLLFLVVATLWSVFKKKDSEDFFMAGRSLRWWSVAGSIFGTNIHAQQIIGMMGVGCSIGFVQAHYEVGAVPALLILAYLFIPLYRKHKFFTLSEFLENRYNTHVRLAYTILMILFIVLLLTGGFYIGSRTLGLLTEGSSFHTSYWGGILIIATVTILFSVLGGMESVVIADNILTIIMILSVVLMGTLTYMQPEIGGFLGLLKLDHAEANRMHLYLPANDKNLPWPGIFFGLTFLHFFYWVTNQYQVQRVLAAKTDQDARLGVIAAGFLKLVIPFFSIAVGAAAYYIFKNRYGEDAIKPDDTFFILLKTVVPAGYGFIGLILAGLTCAIFSAIYSMVNSASTMMSIDIFKKYITPDASDKTLVNFGRIFVVVMCGVCALLALTAYNPESSGNFFLIIEDQTSYIRPGLVVAFFGGIIWRKAHPTAVLIMLIASPFIGWGCDIFYTHVLVKSAWISATFGTELNFLYRIFAITFIGSILLWVVSLFLNSRQKIEYRANQNELVIGFTDIGRVLFHITVIQLPLILLAYFSIISAQTLATPSALLTLALVLWYKKKYQSSMPFYKSDIFYAGLLSATMVFILYYFA